MQQQADRQNANRAISIAGVCGERAQLNRGQVFSRRPFSMALFMAVFCIPFSVVMGTEGDSTNEQKVATSAEELFELIDHLGNSFDVAFADLYSDDAKITNLRKYPDGRIQKIRFDGKRWKEVIRLAVPLAEERGDKDRYSDVSYETKDEGVVIRATRYSELKKYSSPMQWLVRPNSNGEWLIVKEKSESRP